MQSFVSGSVQKIAGFVVVWLIIQGFFGLIGVDSAMAATLSESIQSKIYTYNAILNGLYLLVWPALSLAGFALDNSMIYGSLLGLDAPLWLIRNIIKNIANFILGFMVLFEILKNFFTTGEQGKKAFAVIKKALIAGVAIQASWFVMAAIIDVSTIATYAIGGMPLSVLEGTCEDLGNIKTLPVGTKIDFTATNQNNNINNSFMYYYYVSNNNQKEYFSPCRIHDDRWVVGQQFRGTVDGIDFTPDYCILPSNQFAHFASGQIATNSPILQGFGLAQATDFVGYGSNIRTIVTIKTGGLGDPSIRSGRIAAGFIFDTWAGAKNRATDTGPGIYLLNSEPGTVSADVFANAPALKDLLEKSEGFVGVLITLYKSILHFVSFDTGSSSTDTFVLFLEILLKVAFGIAMLVPLIILAIALVIRIGYIWMFIALSPIIALKIAFDDNETIKGLRGSIPIIKGKPGDIVRIIFAPVIITFAVSFCLVFMTALITSLNNQADNNPSPCFGDHVSVFKAFNIDTDVPDSQMNKTYQIGTIVEVQQNAFGANVTGAGRDIFGWVLINLFGAAIVWLLLMTVIESTFKDTPVGNWKLAKTASNMLGSLPIIPIPTGTGGWTTTGVGSIVKAAEDKASQIEGRVRAKSDILGETRNPKDDETQESASSKKSSIDTLKPDQRAAIATTAATAGVSTLTSSNIPGLDGSSNTINDSELRKSLVINNDLYKQYTQEVSKLQDASSKLSETAKRIVDNIQTFSANELTTILNRNDEIAKRIAPQAVQSTISLQGVDYQINFDAQTGTYSFDDKTISATTPYKPLQENTTITERNKPIDELRPASNP